MVGLLADSAGWAWVFNQGFAGGLLLLVGFGIYFAIRWFGDNIAVPMRDAMVGHLTTTTATMKDISQTLEDTHDQIKTVSDRITNIDNRTERIAENIANNHLAIVSMHHNPTPSRPSRPKSD